MTVNFRSRYWERQNARVLPRLEALVDLELLELRRARWDPKPEARPTTLSADGGTKLHQPGATSPLRQPSTHD